MSISVTCPECFMDFAVPERFAGKKIKCKSCGAPIPVPQSGAATADDLDDFGPAFSPPSLPSRPGQIKPAASPRPAQKGRSSVWMWVLGIAGGTALAVLLCCGGVTLWWRSITTNVDVAEYPNLPDFGEPTSPFPVAQIPVPKFPELGAATPVGTAGAQSHSIDLGSIAGNEGWPGMKMTMRVYLPPGEHAPQSLPCVLVAPAGGNLLSGMSLDVDEYHAEALPYAEAGMAAIFYSVDGGAEMFLDGEDLALKAPYLHFRSACAGVVNARNALEFALAKLPSVDPKRVFAAGHSSAGTLALLTAEHEPRLAGAIAYAPVSDISTWMDGADEAPAALTGLVAPRLKEFLTQSNPTTHATAIRCPLFLFHAKDDQTVLFSQSEKFAETLRTAKKDVTFEIVEASEGLGTGESETVDAVPSEGRDLALQPPGFDIKAAEAEMSEPGPADGELSGEEMSDEEGEDDESFEYDAADSHYTPMIEKGIPRAIEWIKSRTAA